MRHLHLLQSPSLSSNLLQPPLFSSNLLQPPLFSSNLLQPPTSSSLLPLLFLLLPLLLHAQSAPRPTTVGTLHGNRMRVHGLLPGLILQQVGPANESNRDRYGNPPFVHDFNGGPKPVAGVERAGLWLSARDAGGNLRVSAEMEPLAFYAFTAGPYSGDFEADSLNALRWDRFFSVGGYELALHRADWADNGVVDTPLPALLQWPGRGNPHFEAQTGFSLPEGDLAPFVDVDQNGLYDPLSGDYPHPPGVAPDILPGQILWNLFNDAHGTFPGAPLGVEVQSTAWALYCDEAGILNETVFLSHKITNRSGGPLDSVTAALYTDPAVGAYTDDMIGTNVALNSVFVYNRQNVDTSMFTINPNQFGAFPPVATFTYLDRNLYKSMYHHNIILCDPPLQTIEPYFPEEYHYQLHGRWRDGTPLTYGGSGYLTGPATDFAYPGHPADPGAWSMYQWYEICGFMACQVPSLYIGQLPADSSFTFDAAYAFHRGEGLNHLQNIDYAFGRVEQLHFAYTTQFTDACTYPPCLSDCVWPGDLDRDGKVRPRDILPLGVGGGATGPQRSGPATWAPQEAPAWGLSYAGAYDYKHLDANGDGVLDLMDVRLIRHYLGYTTPGYAEPADSYTTGNEILLVPLIGAPFMADTANTKTGARAQVIARINTPDLVGLALDMAFDTNYWQLDTQLAAPHAYNLPERYALLNSSEGKVEYAASAKNPTAVFPVGGNFAFVSLIARAIPDSLPDTTFIRLKNIYGIRPDGTPVPMGSNAVRYCFGGGCAPYVRAEEPGVAPVRMFPNPAYDQVTLQAPGLQWRSIEALDVNGRVLRRWDAPGRDTAVLELGGLPPGWLFFQVQGTDGRMGYQRLLLQ